MSGKKRSSRHKKQDEFIRLYLEALDCPRALTVWLLYSQKEHEQLVQLEFNPTDYDGVEHASGALAATKFLSKARFLKTGINLQEVAFSKFLKAEDQCRETNRRVFTQSGSPQVEAVISIARRKIANILGEIVGRTGNDSYKTELFLEEFIRSCDHGPGATLMIKRSEASKPHKFEVESQICAAGYEFVQQWFQKAWPSWHVNWSITDFSNIVTVPKTAKTDRVIAIEPGLSIWFQKGIGSMIRRRLRRVGLDLDNQHVKNEALSRKGSRDNTLATIDFSAASDTIAHNTVQLLLPRDWFNLLSAFRSSRGKFGDRDLYYEKFSSMGNGFTFELETLIFHVLAVACCRYAVISTEDVSTFGDDVILPTDVVPLYLEVCEYLGFTVNKTKSYWSSGYRESCGAHWFLGYDIKPFFLKETIKNVTKTLYFANSVRAFANRRIDYGDNSRLLHCWEYVVHELRQLTTVSGIPPSYGDVGLHVDLSEVDMYGLRKPKRASHQQDAWWVKCWAPVALSRFTESDGLMLAKLQQAQGFGCNDYLAPSGTREVKSLGNEVPLPGRTRMAKIRLWVYQWSDSRPW